MFICIRTYIYAYICIDPYIYIREHIHIYFICWIRWRPNRRLASLSTLREITQNIFMFMCIRTYIHAYICIDPYIYIYVNTYTYILHVGFDGGRTEG